MGPGAASPNREPGKQRKRKVPLDPGGSVSLIPLPESYTDDPWGLAAAIVCRGICEIRITSGEDSAGTTIVMDTFNPISGGDGLRPMSGPRLDNDAAAARGGAVTMSRNIG